MSKRPRTLVLIALAIVVGTGAGLAIARGNRSTQRLLPAPGQTAASGRSSHFLEAQAVWPAGARRAPNFNLRDQQNRPFTLRSQRGRVVFLTFLNSHCKQACPLEGRQLGEIQRRFSRARRPVLVVVSINPTGDTIASTNAAAQRWAIARPWYWLRGSHAQLARIWREYSIDVQVQQGDIGHSAALYVLDPHSYERAGYLFPFQSHGLTNAVRLLEPRS